MAEARTENPDGLTRGTVVGRRYAIELRIGQGGNGAVYLATDLQDGGRAVALKVLRMDRLDAERERGLRREYATLSRLRHPHVEAVFDFGRDVDFGVFIAKEYLPGQDLLTATARMAPLAALELSMQLFRALAFLHARKLLHNDIKPDNMLVVKDHMDALGVRAVLIDFGIVSEIAAELPGEEGKPRPKPKTVTGTLGYLSPERLRGDPASPASELYAAGILLFRMLTRRYPFSPDSPPKEVMLFHLFKQPPRPSDLRPDVPRSIDYLVEKLLAKAPGDRHRSAHEVLADIGRILGQTAPLETDATQEGYVGSVPLVGRGVELAELNDVVGRGVMGNRKSMEPGMTIVLGGPGMGKTRLVTEALIQARLADSRVLVGHGRRLGGALAPLRDPLRQLLTASERQTALEVVENPELREALGRTKMVEAVARLLMERGTRLVLALEDLHHADELTLDLLLYLGRRLRAQRSASLICLLTAERGESPRFEKLLETFRHEQLARITEVRPLDVAQATELVERAVGAAPPASFVESLLGRTGGAPQVIQEALKFVMAGGFLADDGGLPVWERAGDIIPEGVLPILSARLAVLSSEPRELLRVLALIGRAAPPALVASATGMDAARAASMLSDLSRRDLVVARVVERELAYVVAHDRMAEAILETVDPAERAPLYASISRAIEALPGKYHEDWLIDLAHHTIQSGDAKRAATFGLRAGKRLEEHFAWDRATELYERLLDLPDLGMESRVEAHLRLAGVCEARGDIAGALRQLARALRLAGRAKLPDAQAAALLRGAHLAAVRGATKRAAARAARAGRISEKLGDEGGIAAAQATRADLLSLGADHEQALRLSQEAVRLHEERGDDDATARALLRQGMVLFRKGDWEEAVATFKRSFDLGALVPALDSLGFLELLRGNYDDAQAAFKKGLTEAARRGQRLEEARLMKNLGHLHFELGELREGERLLTEAVAELEARHDRVEAAMGGCTLARLLLERGRIALAAKEVERAMRLLGDDAPDGPLSHVWRISARLHLIRGELVEARRDAERACGVNERWGRARELGYDWLGLADIALEAGERRGTMKNLDRARNSFTKVKATAGLCAAGFLAARAIRHWGEADQVLGGLEAALVTARDRGLKLLAAKVEAEIVDVLFDRREDAAAIARSEAPLAYAKSEGAQALEGQIHLTRARIVKRMTNRRTSIRDIAYVEEMAPDVVQLRHRLRLLSAETTKEPAQEMPALTAHADDVRNRGMVRLAVEADRALGALAERAGDKETADSARRHSREAATAAKLRIDPWDELGAP